MKSFINFPHEHSLRGIAILKGVKRILVRILPTNSSRTGIPSQGEVGRAANALSSGLNFTTTIAILANLREPNKSNSVPEVSSPLVQAAHGPNAFMGTFQNELSSAGKLKLPCGIIGHHHCNKESVGCTRALKEMILVWANTIRPKAST